LFALGFSYLVLESNPLETREKQKKKRTEEYLYGGDTINYGIIDNPDLVVAGIPILQPRNSLCKTTLILGDMGTGKSRLMHLFYNFVREKTDASIIIYDPKVEWLKTAYSKDDSYIYSPYDKRSVNWDIWKDINQFPELIDLISKASVAVHQKDARDTYWRDTASNLISSALSTGNLEDAIKYLKSQKEKNRDDKTFLSTYATAMTGFRDIVSISMSSSNDSTLTLSDFVKKKTKFFLLNPPLIRESNIGPLNIFLSALITYMLSLKNTSNDSEIRTLFLIDEALQFNLPDTVETAITTTARSKGIAYVGSIQHLPGKWKGETHLTKAQTKYIFRCSDPNTAAEVSGWTDFEYEKKVVSLSQNASNSFFLAPDVRKEGLTAHVEKRKGTFIPPMKIKMLENRQFFYLSQNEISVGRTTDVYLEEKDISELEFNEDLRKKVILLMNNL
jgi:hypothetical protein